MVGLQNLDHLVFVKSCSFRTRQVHSNCSRIRKMQIFNFDHPCQYDWFQANWAPDSWAPDSWAPANWAPDSWAPGPSCPGPNLPKTVKNSLCRRIVLVLISLMSQYSLFVLHISLNLNLGIHPCTWSLMLSTWYLVLGSLDQVHGIPAPGTWYLVSL